jgi:E3 ubiquitin-protein ligase TRIP12
VEEYIADVLDAILGKGAQAQIQAFREGFSKVFPVMDLQAFTPEELAMLFGNTDEDWSIESKLHGNLLWREVINISSSTALSEALKADHGFNVESRAIRQLVEIMSEYDASTRRGYLQFITGSPKLPIGGMPYHVVGLGFLLTWCGQVSAVSIRHSPSYASHMRLLSLQTTICRAS